MSRQAGATAVLRVAMAQIDARVGDVDGNADRILEAWRLAADRGADLVVFGELTVTGYPPEDLLLKPAFIEANRAAVDRLADEGPASTAAVVGHVSDGHAHRPQASPGDQRIERRATPLPARHLRNAASVILGGEIVGEYHKSRLPNYGVFDEARYFVPGDEVCVVEVAGVEVGVVICEDLWVADGPVARAVTAGAEVIVDPNASPFERGKHADRLAWVGSHARRHGVPVVYVNLVGGQDDVVFDGDSLAVGASGQVLARAAQFDTDLVVVELDGEPRRGPPRLGPVAEVWEALRLGVRDYVHNNGFEHAVIGLSGGIDSAVTAALAAEALGPDNVTGVLMPSPYTSRTSIEDARALTGRLGIRSREIAIEAAMEAFDGMLADAFAGTEPDVTEENLQARIRGAVLMALSNKFGSIVLAPGNKSELAVGYATLYGDMVGGFAVLKDVPKTLVYRLAEHRNKRGGGPDEPEPVIPQRILDKPPSAELRPDQRDTDSLPPYPVLDDIIEGYVEQDATAEELVAAGHDREVVQRVLRMIDRAEFKRRQAPPGVKITARAFGKDRRVPITTAWRG